jgi:hypothetical protein
MDYIIDLDSIPNGISQRVVAPESLRVRLENLRYNHYTKSILRQPGVQEKKLPATPNCLAL